METPKHSGKIFDRTCLFFFELLKLPEYHHIRFVCKHDEYSSELWKYVFEQYYYQEPLDCLIPAKNGSQYAFYDPRWDELFHQFGAMKAHEVVYEKFKKEQEKAA